jgi:hypothetical protein
MYALTNTLWVGRPLKILKILIKRKMKCISIHLRITIFDKAALFWLIPMQNKEEKNPQISA